ncbi:hypothetical protein [Bordetella bronchiseptica]|uniref:hypothetical protein n=1 Tax=Bordetella bronchiseptica TaxID=518 RepID=UPI0013140EF7|nr:hypothetical protein [Bordetella bronchiseptica]
MQDKPLAPPDPAVAPPDEAAVRALLASHGIAATEREARAVARALARLAGAAPGGSA